LAQVQEGSSLIKPAAACFDQMARSTA